MPTTYLEAIREGLWEEMERDPDVFLIGEDIGVYGGAFKVTDGFLERFGEKRVVDTPISEGAIVGAAIGASLMGLRAVAEMQFADFISCGFDQIVNFAAKCRYRWNAPVPMVIRAPSGGGIHGGPFHSQNPEMWFVKTPGLKVVCPSTAYDAKGLIKASIRDNDPVIFFEHKGLYRKIKEDLPTEEYTVPLGKAKIVREGKHLSIITYGAMVWTALEAAEKLAAEDVSVEVVDLRTLQPLDREAVCETVKKTSKVLLLHEDTRTAGMAGELAITITENVFEYLDAPILRVTAPDTPVPFSSPLEDAFLPNVEKVLEKKLAGFIAINCALAATPEYKAAVAIDGPAKAAVLEDRRGNRAVFADADFPITRALSDFIAAQLVREQNLDRAAIVLRGTGNQSPQPDAVVAAVTAALHNLEPAAITFDGAIISIRTAADACLFALPASACGRGSLVRSPIRAAFQIVEPDSGLRHRSETPVVYPVQAIAFGKDAAVLALGGDARYPVAKGIILIPFANDVVPPPESISAAIRRVLARVGR